MRFTELERSLLAVNAALVARLDLIEQGDDLADTIAKDTATVADLRREANRRETELIDEREDLRKELQRVRDQRDRLYIFASLQPGVVTDSSGILREIAAELDDRQAVPETWGEVRLAEHLTQQKAAKPADLKPLQLEVGKKYRRRDGEIVTIVDSELGCPYQFWSGEKSYLADGRWWKKSFDHDYDLIEEVTEESAEVAA